MIKPFNTNFYLTKHALSGNNTVYTPPVEAWKMEQATFFVNVESLTGTPTSASLSAVLQIGPQQYSAYNLDWQTSGDQRKWTDVNMSNTGLKHMLIDGDWDSPLADQTITSTGKQHIRRFHLAAPVLFRLALTTSFVGGSSPAFNVSVAATMF